MKKFLLSLLFISGFAVAGYGQIFTQNFQSSANITDYYSTTPTINQFNSISSSGSDATPSINAGKLRYTRASANTGTFTRNTNLSTVPTLMKYTLELTVSGNTSSQTNAAVFQIGSGFGTSNSAEANAQVHSRFGINISSVTGNFSLRDIGSSTNTSEYSGSQVITWFINNSSDDVSYTAPNGSTETLATDTWDLWVGTSKELNDRAATTATQTLNNIKFAFSAGAATIDIDNIIISELTVLPVSLTSFTAKANSQNIDLAWSTASEKENAHFDVLRSSDGKTFAKIGEVKGAGTTDVAKNYSFTDKNALPGVNYYQLKQVDNNGSTILSSVEAIKSNVAASNFKVANNKQNGTVRLTVYAANEGKATFKIYDLNGRKITEQALSLSKGYSNVSIPFNGGNGLHIASLTTSSETVTQKFIQ